MTVTTTGEAGGRGDTDPTAKGASGDDAALRTERHPVHRLRALGHRERLWAIAAAMALLAAPVAALVMFLPDWAPANDPALMGLRALDVGSAATPMVGQPSQAGLYTEGVTSIQHPGPLHFYLLAVPIRVLGAPLGMPLVSVLITGSCLLLTAWAVFRQLGRTAGLVAAGALSLVAFTTGASSLIDPVSSNIAGYPLLCTAVLWWCIAAGDVRLLPLAVAVASFTAQQHLSVVPATIVLAAGGLGLFALRWRREGRSDPRDGRDLRRWLGAAVAVGLVLWSPPLFQQAFGNSGNLGGMLWFARHGNSETLGYGSSVRQLAHVFGLPPLLGRTHIDGHDLLAAPSLLTWVSAASVAAGVAALCWYWRRIGSRRATLGAAVGLVVAAGLVNGASVPRGLEQGRLTFYHWAFALAFLLTLIAGLAVTSALARTRLPARRGARPVFAGLVVTAMAVPIAVNPTIDRFTNTPNAAGSPIELAAIDELADAVEAASDRLGDHTLLIARHQPAFIGVDEALSFELAQRGIDVKHPLGNRFFVNDRRLVDRDAIDGGLVLVVGTDLSDGDAPPGGELLADVTPTGDPTPRFDIEAHRSLMAAAAEADEMRLSPAAERRLDAMDAPERAMAQAVLESVLDDPDLALRHPGALAVLLELPPAEPAFDPVAVQRAHDSATYFDLHAIRRLRLYRLDRAGILGVARIREVGRP